MAGSRIKGITIDIDGNTKGLDKALSGVNKEARGVQTELRDVEKLLKLDPHNTELVAQKQALLAKAVSTTEEKLNQLKTAESEVNAQFQKGEIGEEQYRAFQREIASTEGELSKYKSQLSSTDSEQTQLQTSTKRLETLFQATGSEVDDFRNILGSKLTSAIKNGTASADQLDTAFKKIAKQSGIDEGEVSELAQAFDKIDGSPKGLKDATEQLDNLANKSKESGSAISRFKEKLSFGAIAGAGAQAIGTLTGGIGDLIKEGADASDAMQKFDSTMKFAGFGKDQINEAGAAVQDYANKTVYDLGDVSNTTAQLAANGIKDYTGLTEAAGNLNAVAGGNADTFKSVAMVMTQTAGAGKLTTENWNQMADAIPGASGKLQDAMKKNGAYTGNFRDAMAKGQITSDEFAKAIKQLGMTDTAKEAAASTSTFEGAIGNLQANVVTGIQNIIQSIGKANMTKLIDQISNGVVGAFKVLVAVLQTLAKYKDIFVPLAVGAGGLFAVFKGVQAVNTAVTAFKALTTTLKEAEVAQTIVTAATKAWELVMGALKLATAGWTAAQEALNVALVTNSIGLTVIAIAAVIAIIAVVITKMHAWGDIANWLQGVWKAIPGFFSGVWKAIKNAFSAAVSWISSFLKTGFGQAVLFIINPFAGVVNFIIKHWATIKKTFNDATKIITNTMSKAWTAIKTKTSEVWSGITTEISKKFTQAKQKIADIINAIKAKMSAIWGDIKSKVVGIWNDIKSTITNKITGAKETVSKVINAIKGFFSGLKLHFPTLNMGWINTAHQTISNVIGRIKGLFNGMSLHFPHVDIPHIPLPHFSLNGSFNPLKGKIPSVGVNWYAKGGIFNKPTMFAANGGFNGVGEAGPEAALPLNAKTLGGIGKGIAAEMDNNGGDTYLVTIQVMADTSNSTIKKIQSAVEDGIAKSKGKKLRAVGGNA